MQAPGLKMNKEKQGGKRSLESIAPWWIMGIVFTLKKQVTQVAYGAKYCYEHCI